MTIALIFIDAEVQLLPDVIDLPGIAVGLAIGAIGTSAADLTLSPSLLDSIIGAAVGALLLLAVAVGYKLIRGIEGMGYGDVKMLAMIGAILGWQWLFAVVLLASVSGAIIGVGVIVGTGANFKLALPFGVFLGFALLTILFFGGILSSWLPAFRIIL
jgi:leader peptidase (prepilin peptidase)/N-methyltransferase